MKQLVIFLMLLFGVPQLSLAMEEFGKTFLTLESQEKWQNGIRQMIEWSQALPNKKDNKMLVAYESCYAKIKKLQSEGKSDILQEFSEETTFAEQKLLPELLGEKDAIKKLKILLAPYKINFPSDPNKKDTEWQMKSNQAFFAMNAKTSATPIVIIAGSLIPYKMAELRKNNKK